VNTMIFAPDGIVLHRLRPMKSIIVCAQSLCVCWTSVMSCLMWQQSGPVSLCWWCWIVTFGVLWMYIGAWKNHCGSAPVASIGGIWKMSPVMMIGLYLQRVRIACMFFLSTIEISSMYMHMVRGVSKSGRARKAATVILRVNSCGAESSSAAAVDRNRTCLYAFASLAPATDFPVPGPPKSTKVAMGWGGARLVGVGSAVKAAMARNMLRVIEIAAVVTTIAMDVTHMTHYTWWGLVSFGVYNCFAICGAPMQYWGVAITFASIVLVGVVGLSLAQCSMLADAVAEYGVSGYLMGNFAVHYYPLLRIVLDDADVEKRLNVYDYVGQASYGATSVVIYNLWTSTSDVYGCRLSERSVFYAMTAVLPLIMLLAWRQHGRRH
jgi:hypothetical protein